MSSGLTQPIGGWTGGLLGAQPNSNNATGWGLPVAANLLLPRSDASVLTNPANPLSRGYGAGYNLCQPAQPARGYKAE